LTYFVRLRSDSASRRSEAQHSSRASSAVGDSPKLLTYFVRLRAKTKSERSPALEQGE